MCQKVLRDASFFAFLLEADREIAAEARAAGCADCGGVLHSARFRRKPRGGPPEVGEEAELRYSFCCAEEGCRKRRTPASLRFLGRKVYYGIVVVVVSAMLQNPIKERARTHLTRHRPRYVFIAPRESSHERNWASLGGRSQAGNTCRQTIAAPAIATPRFSTIVSTSSGASRRRTT